MRTFLFLALIALGFGSYAAFFSPAATIREAKPSAHEQTVDVLKTRVSDNVNMKASSRPTRVSSAGTI